MNRQPKNILRISDLTFILPDDFEGDLQAAINLVVDHLDNKNIPEVLHDKCSTVKTLLTAENDPKLCMKFGLFTIDEDGNYKLRS